MSKITITLDLHPEYAEPDHDTGCTERAFLAIFGALHPYGDNVEITADDGINRCYPGDADYDAGDQDPAECAERARERAER